jgi:hypothetical protein
MVTLLENAKVPAPLCVKLVPVTAPPVNVVVPELALLVIDPAETPVLVTVMVTGLLVLNVTLSPV